MEKIISVLLGCFLAFSVAHAQADHKLDSQTVANDKIIMHEILAPALKSAREQNQTPDWSILHTTIATRFDATYADRNITKAKIYYFYSHDWPQFSTALVQYTQRYEWHDSLPLLDKNAKMILDHSANPADWKAAQSRAKYVSDKNPSNDAYRATYEALTAKLEGK